MDNPIFFIEMPHLSDEAVAGIETFLWDLINAFESQYYNQLKRYHNSPHPFEKNQSEDSNLF